VSFEMMNLLTVKSSPLKDVIFIFTSFNGEYSSVNKVIISKDSELYNHLNENSEGYPAYWGTQFDQIIMVCLNASPPSSTIQDFKFLQNSSYLIENCKCCQKEVKVAILPLPMPDLKGWGSPFPCPLCTLGSTIILVFLD
jgi:hypothetical protein